MKQRRRKKQRRHCKAHAPQMRKQDRELKSRFGRRTHDWLAGCPSANNLATGPCLCCLDVGYIVAWGLVMAKSDIDTAAILGHSLGIVPICRLLWCCIVFVSRFGSSDAVSKQFEEAFTALGDTVSTVVLDRSTWFVSLKWISLQGNLPLVFNKHLEIMSNLSSGLWSWSYRRRRYPCHFLAKCRTTARHTGTITAMSASWKRVQLKLQPSTASLSARRLHT